MKKILPIFLLTVVFAKTYGQSQDCNFTNDKIVSISGGSPFNLRFEGGIMWSQVGVEAGVKTYSVTKTIKGKSTEADLAIAPYAKGIVRLFGAGNFRSYITGYYGLNVYGASLKLGWAVTDGLMINVEPAVTKETGTEFNAGITIRL
ncbi:MAG: hypothetical protein JST96_16010 [Bacteroidetes bacterium]|nr:hypothetical protein [Bacteroidota bacterium]